MAIDCLRQMQTNEITELVILDGERPVGVVRLQDLIAAGLLAPRRAAWRMADVYFWCRRSPFCALPAPSRRYCATRLFQTKE